MTHVCSRCQERTRYGRITDLGDVSIVGPRGVAHIQHEWNLERTLCGRNATGTDWWWRLAVNADDVSEVEALRDYNDRVIETVRNHSSDTNAWPGWANSLADEVIALRSAFDPMRHELQQEKVRANNWEGVATDQEAALDSMREERDTFKRGVNENAALVDEQRERAEAAEAELARLREGLIAKATFWEENAGRFTHGADTVLRESAHALRVLATPPDTAP